MCDITRRSVCYGGRRHQHTPVKLSKWELPIPNTTYWDDICHEIEKKYKKVRDPYPSSFPYPLPKSSSRSTLSPRSDDIKFKISPPTPGHYAQKSAFKHDKNNLSDKSIVNQGNEFNVVDKNLKLPPLFQKKGKINTENDANFAKKLRKKIYSKDFCPQHKNVSAVKIFDDEISKYLKRPISSVPKLPKVTKTKPSLRKEAQSFRSSSASSVQSKASKAEVQQPKKIMKAPKLGMASLLPSFAKAISIDSCDTRESIESDDGIYEVQPQTQNEIGLSQRDFLRVPNFSFVSSHPSFRYLSSVDSYNETDDSQEFAIVSKGDFLQAEKYLKPDGMPDSVVEESQLTSDHQSSNVDETKEVETAKEKEESIEMITNLEKKYAHKALDLLMKKKHKSRVKRRADVSDDDIESARSKDDRSLKSLNLDELESITMRTSSRSTSGLSADFKNKTIANVTPDNNVLEKLPKTVVYQRASIDRCLACLPKPLSRSAKVYRELPITTLKYIVENPTDFRVSSSSSSSSSLSMENSNYFISDRDIDTGNILLREDQSSEINVQKQKEVIQAKDQIKVSFDERNLHPASKASSETLSPAHKSTSSKEQLLLDRSLSIQSTDRSKTSSPSLQSSDSDEPGFQDDKLPSSKSTAPCHAAVVWRKSLEPLRALRQKKFVSLRARAATVTAKSSDDSGSDSDQDVGTSKKQDEAKTKTPGEDSQSQSKKEKKKKPLIRMKTVADQLTIFSRVHDEQSKQKLKRSKSTFDLATIPDDSGSSESNEEVDSEDVKPEEKDEPLPFAEPILMHRAGSPPPPIMSAQDIADIIRNVSMENFDASDLFNQLGSEFLKKLQERLKLYKNNDNNAYIKLGINLFEALLDSRRYLKSDTFDPNLEFSHKQPPLSNSRQLRRILPPKSFQMVAPILGMPLVSSSKKRKSRTRTRIECSSNSDTDVSLKSFIKWDKIVHHPSSGKSGKHVAYFAAKNPYALFLKKPRRKAVVWRPLREEDMKGYDPEATLEMRATRLMNKICKNFCDWLKQLGGNEQVIDEETLKDMFEINFTAEACKAMQVILKEMPTIPGAVARARNCPEAGELEATRQELRKDVKLESRSKRIHAFGRSLPNDSRFVPPTGRVSTKWVECKNIPRDLETMDVVWHDIMDKDIVSAFIDYLKKSPQAAPSRLQTNLEQKKNEYLKMIQTGDGIITSYIHLDADNIADNALQFLSSVSVI